MRRIGGIGIVLLSAGACVMPALSEQQPAKAPAPQPSQQSAQQSSQQQAQAPSVAEAARRARAKKAAGKSGTVYTNDNLPKNGKISVVGQASAADSDDAAPAAGEAAGAAADAQAGAAPGQEDPKSEVAWRKKFADAREKVAAAEKEADVLQREFNLMQVQYGSDPNKVLREEYERKGINDTRKKIDDKKAEVARLKQAISDLEDQLRKAGLPAGWAR